MFKNLKNNFSISFFILILILFLPPFSDGGRNIFISEIILILIGLLFLFNLKKGGVKIFYSKYLFFLNLYLIFSLIAVFFSVSPYNSLIIWIQNLGYAILFLCASQIKFRKQEINCLLKIFLAVIGALCLAGIYFYLTGGYSRLTSTFWWPNPFAGYLLFALPISFYFFIKDNSRFKLLSAPLLILILASFILTGSRGAFLSIVISIFVFSLLNIFMSSRRSLVIFLKKHCLSLLCIIILFTTLIFIINAIKADSMAFAKRASDSQDALDVSSNIRIDYWKGTLEIFRDYPIFGSGLGSFSNVYPKYQENPISAGKYAHNWYLEILSEQGILVLIVFILFLSSIFMEFIKRKNVALQPFDFALSIGLLAFLIHNAVDMGSHYPANMVLFWFFLGIITMRNMKCAAHNIKYKKLLRAICFLLIIKGIIFLYSNYNFLKGLEYQKIGEFQIAQNYYAKSVILNSDPNYLRQYGIILYSQAINFSNKEMLLNKALEISKKIIKLDSHNDLNYELRGRVYKELDELEEAEKDFRKAIKLNKFTPRHYINLSSFLIQENRLSEANDLIDEILAIYSQDVVEIRKLHILKNQKTTSGIEKDIDYLKNLKNNIE